MLSVLADVLPVDLLALAGSLDLVGGIGGGVIVLPGIVEQFFELASSFQSFPI